MHHDGIEAADFQHHHVAGELVGKRRIDHGMAAELDDDDLVVIALQEGQGLGENLGRGGQGQVSHGHVPGWNRLRLTLLQLLTQTS